MGEKNTYTSDNEGATREEWWKLPFDTTTNFSLLGFFLGGSYWTWNADKTVDLTLDE